VLDQGLLEQAFQLAKAVLQTGQAVGIDYDVKVTPPDPHPPYTITVSIASDPFMPDPTYQTDAGALWVLVTDDRGDPLWDVTRQALDLLGIASVTNLVQT